MKRFRIKGIKAPGIVDLYGHGKVTLSDISDELAEQLIKEGCPFLEPIPDAPKPKYLIEATKTAKGKPEEKTEE